MRKSLISALPLHVLFFSAFPSLILLVNNLGQADLQLLFRPLLYSLLMASLLLLALRLIVKDWLALGLSISWFLLLFFTYGHVYQVSKGYLIFDILVGRHRYLIGLWITLFALGVYLINRKLGRIEELTLLLNGISFLLVLFQLIQLSVYEIQRGISQRQAKSSAQAMLINPDKPDELPDVYLIILDMYGREDALMAHYGYDNHEFVTQLEGLGFYVAKCGRSNYSKTVLSLPSQLNMDYVDNLMEDPDLEKYAYLLKNNAVLHALEDIGYTTIAFDTGAGWANLDGVDQFIDRPPEILGRGLEDFEQLFLKTTLARPLLDYAEQLDRAGFHFFETGVEMKAQRIRIVLNHLRLMPEQEGPKFVYAHMIAPHPPHVFNPDGTVNLNAENIDGQVGLPIQLNYLNPQIIDIVGNIIAESAVDPIIIIEGDHGFANLQRTSILLAMYLPGDGENLLYPTITLVNTFRIIFDTYFGANLPLLEDRAYKMLNDISLEYAPHPEWNPECMK